LQVLAARQQRVSSDCAVLLLQTHTYLSTTHLAAGTASYMAPECFAGGHVGEKADVYSLGCMLWECVTGERPWRGLNVVQVAYQVRACHGLGGILSGLLWRS
jgi:serine/threonine protein kinase